jgi:Glucose / Sorbosone dehydrogenase
MPWISRLRLTGSLVVAALAVACGSRTPAPPQTSTPSPGDVVQITGQERLGWTQPAANIGATRFAVYVDAATRLELSAATCAAAGDETRSCESPLPPLSKGRHSLELVAWIDDSGNVLESTKSPALAVDVLTGTAASSTGIGAGTEGALPQTPAPPPTASACGIAPLPGGELLTWDSGGTIAIFDLESQRSRRLSWNTSDPELWVLGGVAAGPQFAVTGWIYVAEMTRDEEPRLRIARYRKKGNVLGERAILFQDALSARPGRLRLSAGPDDRLYVALLAEDESRARPTASPLPFLIRLMSDGRLPIENAGGSVFAGVAATHPIDVAWRGADPLPWTIESLRPHDYRVAPRSPGDSQPASYFSSLSPPVAAEFGWRGAEPALWITMENGDVLRFDESAAGWVIGSRRQLAPPLPIQDARRAGDQDMVVCGPAPDSRRGESSSYGIWRRPFRD